MLLNGSQILMETLLEQGVDTIFGYPGGAILNIYDALYKYSDKIRHICTSHEQHAAHAADGYARITGRTGVVFATSGPGAANLVTGIATANMDSIPLVAITANVNSDLLGRDSFQEIDISHVVAPVTKKSYLVTDVTKLADVVREAFFIANDGRKGAVLIDITKDVTSAVCEFKNVPPKAHDRPCDIHGVEEAAKIINAAKRPYIFAGGGVRLSGAEKELKALAEKIDAPVSLSLMAKDCLDNMDERCLGMLGMHGTKVSSVALTEADVIIALGTRFSDRVTCNTKSFAENIKGAKVVHIDIDRKEFNKNVLADCKVYGDVKTVLDQLIDKLDKVSHPEMMAHIADIKSRYPLVQDADSDAVTPKYVLEMLAEVTGREAVITTEVGQHQMWAAEYYPFKDPHSLATSGGQGTMGYGLGAAIGAKVGCPEKTVVNIAGDGSFYMNMAELSTLAKYGLPVIELVFNNTVLGMVRQWQKLFYGERYSQTDVEKDTDFEMLGKAFGIETITIDSKSGVKEKLGYAVSCGKPVLINVLIDKDLNVLPMVPAGASVTEPMLEI
ncbi:MAG: biosynthetic-type acetolactate synthase large subunit [Oscillospiraceae bacterium]|nr:biosynthetic-type acetolactate synthase large subunit [Oscillospiraceae bacterium]